jgi:hypothetical protein
LTPPPQEHPETEEELEIFAGYTRVVANKVLARGFRRDSEPNFTHEHSDPSPVQQNDPEVLLLDFDPSIIEYFALPTFETYPAPAVEDTGLHGSDSQQLQYVVEDKQWEEFLQSL